MAVRRKKRRKMTAKQARYFGPKRRRRHKRKVYAANPPKRRRRTVRKRAVHRRRSYHHNPPAIRSIASELGWTAAGYMATKVVGNFVTPMVGGIVGEQPLMRMGLKLGVAYLSAWGLSSFLGQRVFMPAMIGGSMEVVTDAIKTFIAPTFPMLADYGTGLEIYYEPRQVAQRGMGLYPELGDGLSPDHDVVV